MKNILVASDSFKGTLTQMDICHLAKALACERYPDLCVRTLPITDGGDGSLDCIFNILGGKIVEISTSDHYMRPIKARYLLLGDGTAIVESAAACGLMLNERRDVLSADTRGVGELVLSAKNNGAVRILLCLGGSGSSDGGCGMAYSLGVRFYDKEGRSFVPNGRTAKDIVKIEKPHEPLFDKCELLVLSDTNVTLSGERSAARVYAAQKGAGDAEIEENERALSNLARLLGGSIGIAGGGGAAGGIGAMALYLGGRIVSGIQTVLDTIDFDSYLDGTDLVITGEGRFDSQSLTGKAVMGVLSRTSQRGVPSVLLVGETGGDVDCGVLGRLCVRGIFECSKTLPSSKREAEETYLMALSRVFDAIRAGKF